MSACLNVLLVVGVVCLGKDLMAVVKSHFEDGILLRSRNCAARSERLSNSVFMPGTVDGTDAVSPEESGDQVLEGL